MTSDIIAYSAVSKGYQPICFDSGIIYTDITKFILPKLNAKIYKCLPHLFVPPHEWSVWVDAKIKLNVAPKVLVDMCKDKEILAFHHPERDCLYQEANVCIDNKLDSKLIILEQIDRYKKDGFPEHAGLPAAGIIVRKNTKQMQRLNEQWWAEICAGSHRDQLSFPYVYRDVQYVHGINCYEPNEYFTRAK